MSVYSEVRKLFFIYSECHLILVRHSVPDIKLLNLCVSILKCKE